MVLYLKLLFQDMEFWTILYVSFKKGMSIEKPQKFSVFL